MTAFQEWVEKPAVRIVLGMMRIAGPTEKDLRDFAEIAFEAGVVAGMQQAGARIDAFQKRQIERLAAKGECE